MDPRSIAQGALADWSLKMGYFSRDGSVPEPGDFAAAASTARRRCLFNAIIAKAKDRRQIRKIRTELAGAEKKDEANDRVEVTRLQAYEVEAEIECAVKRIKTRIANVASIEASIRELEVKEILFSRTRSRNECLIAAYRDTANSLEQLSLLPAKHSSEDPEEWVERVLSEMRGLWCDPALSIEIANQTAGVSENVLWRTLNKRLELLADDMSLEDKIIETYDVMRRKAPRTFDWAEHLAKLRLQCIITNTNTLLLYGQGLSKIAKVTDPLKEDALQVNQHNLHPTSADEIEGGMDEVVLCSLRAEESERRKIYEMLKGEVSLLRERYSVTSGNVASARRALLALVGDVVTRTRVDAPLWRTKIERRRALARQHTDIMWHELRHITRQFNGFGRHLELFPSLPKAKLDILGEHDFDQPSQGVANIRLLLNDVEASDDLEEGSIGGRRLRRTLRICQDRADGLIQKTKDIERILTLFSTQPFGALIPESLKVNGHTWKEWHLQSSLLNVSALSSRIDKLEFSIHPYF